MSQDPNSGYGNDPNNPYGAPQNPYQGQPNPNAPQNPYQGQPNPNAPQNPYPGQPNPNAPQNPYQGQPSPNVPQNPYQPQQNPYQGQPGPYGQPAQGQYQGQPGLYGQPVQGQYAGGPPQNPYGAPGYGQYGYGAPSVAGSAPLPLNEAVRQLPEQYRRTLTQPSAATFEAELPKASWDIVWVQLLIWVAFSVVFGLIVGLLSPVIIRNVTGFPSSMGPYTSLLTASTTVGGSIAQIITIPLFFFIGTGIQYLLAKAFKGEGTFLGQSYTALLYVVPLRIIGAVISILNLIPIAGSILVGLIGLALGIYGIVLNVFQIKASHRLTTGKAVWVVLIPYLVVIVLAFLCAIAFAGLFLTILRQTGGNPYNP